MFGTKKKKVSEKELRAIAWEEFKKEMLPKILEEAKTPGTYPTKINVARTGEGHFVQVGKTTAEATQFINSIVCHRCQVMNISTKADKSLLDQYIAKLKYIMKSIIELNLKILKYTFYIDTLFNDFDDE